MTHKNIVIYYQAWVEGEVFADQEHITSKQSTSNNISRESNAVETILEDSIFDSSNSTNSDSDAHTFDGFDWDKSPCSNSQNLKEAKISPGKMGECSIIRSKYSNPSHCSNSSDYTDWSETTNASFLHNVHSSVYDDSDDEKEFGLQSPLLGGICLQSKAYTAFHGKSTESSDTSTKIAHDGSLFNDSSSQRTKNISSHKVMYIQTCC